MELTVTVTFAVSMGIPPGPGPVPVTVIVYVPVAVLAAVTVNVDVAGVTTVTPPGTEVVVGDTLVGLRLAVNPLPVTVEVSETLPENPLMGVTVIVEVPDDPLLMFKDVGEAEIEKSCTFTANAVL